MSVRIYHETTKHHLHAYAPGPGYLDWANQPYAFRIFTGAEKILLKFCSDDIAYSFKEIQTPQELPASEINLDSISAFFELAFGISAWKAIDQTKWALRCNPSSGNLHPTESYLICGNHSGLNSGVYHYTSLEHALEQRFASVWNQLELKQGFFIALTSIIWREAWKYGARAFRYCQHDTGHAIAAIAYAAACLGWETKLIHQLGDDEIAKLTGLHRHEDFVKEELEFPECALWIGSTSTHPELCNLLSDPSSWFGKAKRLSAQHVVWPEIERVKNDVLKPNTKNSEPKKDKIEDRLPFSFNPHAVKIIKQRRSAVDFDGISNLELSKFLELMDAVLPRCDLVPWRTFDCQSHLHLFLFIHRVDGLQPGLYALPRSAGILTQLKNELRTEWLWERVGHAPQHIPLYLLAPMDVRQVSKIISCHQDIAADSFFSLGMIAEFDAPLTNSEWMYRYLFWEAGMIGQVLYLEAERMGVRATGIGCYFDDAMHDLLGIKNKNFQDMYHFTVGVAVEDKRLTTLDPYHHLDTKTRI